MSSSILLKNHQERRRPASRGVRQHDVEAKVISPSRKGLPLQAAKVVTFMAVGEHVSRVVP